jgi:voltage-gated potassium channel
MIDQVPVPGAIHGTRGRREWLRTLLTVGGMIGVYFIAPFGQDDDPLPLAVATTLSIVVALVLAFIIARRIIGVLDGTSSEGIPGLVTILVLVVVVFAAAYFLLARSDPTQVTGLRTRLDSMYFTLTTLVTVGYGDIYPSGQAARALACFQFAFNAILVTGLVRAIFHQEQVKRASMRG